MKMGTGLKNNPGWIYVYWCIIIFLLTIISIPIFSINSFGGDQKLYILIEKAYVILFYGFLILSIIITVLFWRWFRKYWYINSAIFLFSFIIMLNTYWKKTEELYYREVTMKEGKDEIFIRKEYSVKTDKIISIKYWRNENKDSIWKFYNDEGKLIEQKLYKNDSLIRSWK